MSVKKIDGILVGLYLSTNLTTPDYKEIVCGDQVGLDGSADVATKRTKCGVLKNVGPAAWQITGSGVANVTPGTGEISADEVLDIFQNGTNCLVKAEATDGTTIYLRKGTGQLSKYTEKSSSADMVEFDFTIDISGDITTS